MSMQDGDRYIEWNAYRLHKFVEAYEDARQNNQDTFTFLGYDFVMAYAFYLVQYLNDQLGCDYEVQRP